jgi:hypothetical protein
MWKLILSKIFSKVSYKNMDDDERQSETTEKEFLVGPDQVYYESDRDIKVGFVSHDSNEYKGGLRSGMSVIFADKIRDGKRIIKVITHINGEPQGSDVSYGGGGKRKKRKYSKKSTKRKSKKKGSKKRRKSKNKTKRRR